MFAVVEFNIILCLYYRHVDFLLAKVISGPGIFHIETPVSYTTSLPGNVVYITARFKFEEVPTTFVIGDGKSYGGYFNGPLEGGFAYSYALRSYSVSVSKQVGCAYIRKFLLFCTISFLHRFSLAPAQIYIFLSVSLSFLSNTTSSSYYCNAIVRCNLAISTQDK